MGVLQISYSQYTFELSIGTPEDYPIVCNAAIDMAGNVILVGNIRSPYTNDTDAYIIKVMPDGNFNARHFDKTDTLGVFNTVKILDNGNYFVIGSYSTEGNYFEMNLLWCAILNSDLNIISEKSYKVRDPHVGFGSLVQVLTDNEGNIIIATNAGDETTNNVFADLAFYKFDQQGDTLLSKYYQYNSDEWPYEFTKVPGTDNTMLIERSTHYNGHDELMFLDPEFNILSINQFGNDNMYGGIKCSDYWTSVSTFLMTGEDSYDKNDKYIGVYKVDTLATVHQELILNKPDTIDYPAWQNSMAYANDTTIYIGGFQTHNWFWVLESSIVELYVIDKNMNLLGYKQLGGDANYELRGIIATDDGGCLLYGERYDNPNVHEKDIHIWKVLREDINIITNITETSAANDKIKIYPNPVDDNLNINLPDGLYFDYLEISIYTLDGKKVYQEKITGSGNLITSNLKNLQAGAYGLVLSDSKQILHSAKIIKN